jgi:2-aminoethylphosphonate-pyruvate transaminase
VTPASPHYDFCRFYRRLKERGFVIYPGKVARRDTFRIGNIGDVQPGDIRRLMDAVENSIFFGNDL